MSKEAYGIVNGWYDAVRGKGEEPPLDCFQIMVRGDLLYSYGRHFELARPLRNKRGKVHGYLLNGDTYSQTTTQHQAHVRHLLSDEQTVIIPYEALNSAGIDLETVQIVHVKADRWTTTHHRTTERPPRSRWVDHEVRKQVNRTEDEINAILDKRHAEALVAYHHRVKWHEEAIAGGRVSPWKSVVEAGPPQRPGPETLYPHEKKKSVVVRVERKLHQNNREWGDEIDVQTLPDGTVEYSWDTTRHWLGESLIRARITWTASKMCRTCNGTGWGIGPTIWRNNWIDCPDCRGQGRHASRHHRWAYYLSGFDHEEARPLYFFAELPRGAKPATVAEAYEALKPDPVKMAEQMNRPVFRQGDIFGVPLEAMDRKALKALGARMERRNMSTNPDIRLPINLPYVLNTNHTATEVAYLPGGVTLARGTMYHDPEGRRADHARRRIGDGKTWHVVIKNTVPITRR
jgi:hypothetical protein